MRYKQLGNSGLRVSEICLGTMSFGDAWGFGANEDVSGQIIQAYGEAGGNFLDTANKYHEGHTEEIVGAHIKSDRDRWVLATKYTLSMRGDDVNAAGNSRKNMMRSVDASLKRLKTDYIDLLWVHAWDFATPVEEVMRGLDDLVRAGKVLYVGISDAPAWVVSQANMLADLRGWSAFVGLQVQYSLIERTVERELLPMAKQLGITTTPWAPLGGGVLTGKHTRGSGEVDTLRSNDDRLTEKNLEIARMVDKVADEVGKSSAQVAVKWVQQRGSDIIPIVGARKLDQIKDVLAATEFSLEDSHMKALNDVSAIELGFPHGFLGVDYVRKLVYGELEERFDLPPLAHPRK